MYANNFFEGKISNENFQLIQTNGYKNKKFNTQTFDFKVVFKNIPSEFVDSVFYMNEIMQLIAESLVAECGKNDKIKIIINHPVLTERIELPFVLAENFTSDMIMSE